MSATLNILWKDLLIEWSTRSRTIALLSFAYTILKPILPRNFVRMIHVHHGDEASLLLKQGCRHR